MNEKLVPFMKILPKLETNFIFKIKIFVPNSEAKYFFRPNLFITDSSKTEFFLPDSVFKQSKTKFLLIRDIFSCMI